MRTIETQETLSALGRAAFEVPPEWLTAQVFAVQVFDSLDAPDDCAHVEAAAIVPSEEVAHNYASYAEMHTEGKRIQIEPVWLQ